MRRSAAAMLGTLTGIALMSAAKLGTTMPSDTTTVATAPLDPETGSQADLTTATPIATPAVTGQPTAPAASPGGAASPKPGATVPGPGAPTTPSGATGLRNGTFAGSTVTHKYGTLQLTIVVSGGRIADVRSSYQTSSPVSKGINADALPKLRSETLSIQSAQVHTVSGATYTSNAYRTSLQSALDKARA